MANLVTLKVFNPSHRSSYAPNTCFGCGEIIEDKKEQVTRPSNKRHGGNVNPMKHYHNHCWEETFHGA